MHAAVVADVETTASRPHRRGGSGARGEERKRREQEERTNQRRAELATLQRWVEALGRSASALGVQVARRCSSSAAAGQDGSGSGSAMEHEQQQGDDDGADSDSCVRVRGWTKPKRCAAPRADVSSEGTPVAAAATTVASDLSTMQRAAAETLAKLAEAGSDEESESSGSSDSCSVASDDGSFLDVTEAQLAREEARRMRDAALWAAETETANGLKREVASTKRADEHKGSSFGVTTGACGGSGVAAAAVSSLEKTAAGTEQERGDADNGSGDGGDGHAVAKHIDPRPSRTLIRTLTALQLPMLHASEHAGGPPPPIGTQQAAVMQAVAAAATATERGAAVGRAETDESCSAAAAELQRADLPCAAGELSADVRASLDGFHRERSLHAACLAALNMTGRLNKLGSMRLRYRLKRQQRNGAKITELLGAALSLEEQATQLAAEQAAQRAVDEAREARDRAKAALVEAERVLREAAAARSVLAPLEIERIERRRTIARLRRRQENIEISLAHARRDRTVLRAVEQYAQTIAAQCRSRSSAATETVPQGPGVAMVDARTLTEISRHYAYMCRDVSGPVATGNSNGDVKPDDVVAAAAGGGGGGAAAAAAAEPAESTTAAQVVTMDLGDGAGLVALPAAHGCLVTMHCPLEGLATGILQVVRGGASNAADPVLGWRVVFPGAIARQALEIPAGDVGAGQLQRALGRTTAVLTHTGVLHHRVPKGTPEAPDRVRLCTEKLICALRAERERQVMLMRVGSGGPGQAGGKQLRKLEMAVFGDGVCEGFASPSGPPETVDPVQLPANVCSLNSNHMSPDDDSPVMQHALQACALKPTSERVLMLVHAPYYIKRLVGILRQARSTRVFVPVAGCGASAVKVAVATAHIPVLVQDSESEDDTNAACEPSAADVEQRRRELVKFYSSRNPDKIDSVPKLMREYSFDEIVQAVWRKYEELPDGWEKYLGGIMQRNPAFATDEVKRKAATVIGGRATKRVKVGKSQPAKNFGGVLLPLERRREVEHACGGGESEIDTFMSTDTLSAALQAVAIVCRAVDRVFICPKEGTNAFCLVRPPGHHAGYVGATAECGQHGFCFFNNVVLGATHARLQWGMKRFAVIDIDVHYGNGTAELLEHDEEAFFASLHLKHNDFFPSDACIGDDVDTKNRVSIGLQPNQKGKTSRGGSDTAATGAAAFRHVLSTRILPRCKEFQPDLIFISAGFDGLATDPVGGELGLSVEDYRWATEQIVQVAEECCEGRLVSVLEGGYDIDKGSMSGLVQAVDAHVGVLMGKSPHNLAAERSEGGAQQRQEL